MNDNDKVSPLEENVSPENQNLSGDKENAAVQTEASVSIEKSDNSCAETESPAEAISEATDRLADEKEVCGGEEKACAETESPAEAISEATDRMEGEEEAETDEKRMFSKSFHLMTEEELVENMRNILDGDHMDAYREATGLRQAMYNIQNRAADEQLMAFVEAGNAPEDFSAAPSPAAAEFNELYNEFRTRRTAFLAAEEAQRNANLDKKKEIVERIRQMSEDIDNINLKYSDFRQLQQDFKAIKDIPQSSETDIWKQFQTVTEQFYDRLKMNKELRDLDFKKNHELKRALVDEVKHLETDEDVVGALRKLQTLRDSWREIGPVAKEIREEIWNEFNASATVVFKRHQTYFENRKAAEQEAADTKTKIIEQVEAFAGGEYKSSKEWEKAGDSIKELQEQWKSAGFTPRKLGNELYGRFREACDKFFNRRNEYYKTTRANFDAAIKGKESLIERVTALQEMEDTGKAVAEAIKLQEEWKKTGQAPHRLKDELWKRFRSACDVIFDRRKKETIAQRQEQNANLEAKREVIAALREIPMDLDRREGIDRIRELQEKWNSIGYVPFKQKNALHDEYRQVVDSLYDHFKARENRQRMNNFREKIDSSDDNKLSRDRDRLLRDLDRKRQELKTYQNNLGFFNVKSSAGNSMLKEMERRTAQIEEEIAMLQKKIEMVDSKIN